MASKHDFYGLSSLLTASVLAVVSAMGGSIGVVNARTSETTTYQSARQLPSSQTRFGLADFAENWDSYVAGSNVHGQGGWKGWENLPAAGALVDDAFSTSVPNSINIEGPSDLIQEFDYNSGIWTITAQQYIPDDFAGRSYYIFENVYNDQLLDLSWSVQVAFDSATGNVENEVDAESPGELPYVTGEWVELMLVVDLDADTQIFYYGGEELYSGSWAGQFPDQNTAGILEIGAIDLFANGATPVYYDDISIVAGAPAEFGVQLGVDPLEGLGQPGDTVTYTVTVTNAGTSDDTFNIGTTGVWAATPSVTSIAVTAGTSATLDVDVAIPSTAVDGDSDTTTLTATSQGDPLVEASVDFTTTVGLPEEIFADGFDPIVP